MAKDAVADPEDHQASGSARDHVDDEVATLENLNSRLIPYSTGNPHDMLREQFFLNIEVERLFASHPDPEARRAEVETHLNRAMERRTSWRSAYHAEQLLVGLMDKDKLALEAERRLVDAERQSLSATTNFRAEYAEIRQRIDEDGTGERLRNLVLRIVSDSQWRRTRRFLERRFAAAYVNRINFIWIVCTLCFLFSVVLIDWLPDWLFTRTAVEAVYVTPAEGNVTLAPGRPLVPSDAARLVQPQVDLPRLAGLWLALFTGLLGASFSMIAMAQRRLKNISLEELQLQSKWEFLLLRLGFGSGAAVILYFGFQAGLVSGALFPDLTQIGVLENAPKSGVAWGTWVPNASLAALMVWSFVAGFSENFVPNFLRKVDDPDKQAPG